jgi:hypothetical protein
MHQRKLKQRKGEFISQSKYDINDWTILEEVSWSNCNKWITLIGLKSTRNESSYVLEPFHIYLTQLIWWRQEKMVQADTIYDGAVLQHKL